VARKKFKGLLVPAVTPVDQQLRPDQDAFIGLCKWLLNNGADGLAVFGTTSEANSFTVAERMALLDVLVGAGVPPETLLPGVGMCAMGDTIALCRHALAVGCGGVLSLPPFYYKPVSVEGLYAWYSRVIEAVGSDKLDIWLYHIPQVSGVGIPLELIDKLTRSYPNTVVGMKDSSGNWEYTESVLKNFPGFGMFPSSESLLVRGSELGASGCITASGNVNPHGIRSLLDALGTPRAEMLQKEVARVRSIVSEHPLIPAVKGLLSIEFGDNRFSTLRPPLTALSASNIEELHSSLRGTGWELPPWMAD